MCAHGGNTSACVYTVVLLVRAHSGITSACAHSGNTSACVYTVVLLVRAHSVYY